MDLLLRFKQVDSRDHWRSNTKERYQTISLDSTKHPLEKDTCSPLTWKRCKLAKYFLALIIPPTRPISKSQSGPTIICQLSQTCPSTPRRTKATRRSHPSRKRRR